MHLDCLGSDDPRFKRLEFHSGFNLILADKTEGSGATDSRNGAGKTSIIRLLRYLLGGKSTPWINNLKEYKDFIDEEKENTDKSLRKPYES